MDRLELALNSVASADTEKFTELVKVSGLSKKRDFIGADLTNMIFDYENLEGFDFSGADFRGSSFKGTAFVGSNLAGAVFDASDLILVDGLEISPSDPDFSEIARLADAGSNSSRMAERSDALVELLKRYGGKKGIGDHVRKTAVNDKAIGVARALQKHLVGNNEDMKLQYLKEILTGRNSYRHRSRVFLEALELSNRSGAEKSFLMHYAVKMPHVIHENIDSVIADQELRSFVFDHLKVEAASNPLNSISASVFADFTKGLVGTQYFQEMIDYVTNELSLPNRNIDNKFWQVAVALKAKYGAEVFPGHRDAMDNLKKNVVDLLDRSGSFESEVTHVVTTEDIRSAGLSQHVWEWFLLRYSPEYYGEYGAEEYYIHDLYKWIDAPYYYAEAETSLMKYIVECRSRFATAVSIESEARRFSDSLGEFRDTLDLWKSQLFGKRTVPNVKSPFGSDEWSDTSEE